MAIGPGGLSSEMLGFASDARVLIVNCDDFGMHDAVNDGVVASIEQGIASSCSLIVLCPASTSAMQLMQDRPWIPFGVHLTLVREVDSFRWEPMSDSAEVPTLVTDDGLLFLETDASALLNQAKLTEVEREIRAQIETVLDFGLAPTHLDWHCIADGGRLDILELTLQLAAEYRLAARVSLPPGRQQARERGLPVVDHDVLDSFSLDLTGKADRYAEMLRNLPAGLSEWAVHPSVRSDDAEVNVPGWPVRHSDYEFLISPNARAILDREGIAVIDYSVLQRAWSQGGTPEVGTLESEDAGGGCVDASAQHMEKR